MKKASFVQLAPLLLGILLPASARAGSISGRVLDPGGNAVAGARVQWLAYRDEDQTRLDETRGTDAAPLGEMKTDAEGRFRVMLAEPGLSVALRVLPEGLPSARFSGPFDSGEDTDLFDVQIPAAARAAGRVFDESGAPISGARVLAVGSEAPLETEARFLSEARTGADGSFSMTGAPAGPRALVAAAPGFVRSQRVQIDPKGDERIVLKRGGSVKGVVLDTSGMPVAGAIVTAGDIATVTDASGQYRISGVAPGPQHVQTIWKEDFAARADSLRVKKGEEVEAPLKLARAASVSGSVVEEKSKKVLAGVRISVSTATGLGPGRRASEGLARTDARGRFRVGGLAQRPYRIEATKDGYISSFLPDVAASASKAATANLALRRAASVAGKIVDEKSQPVAGARVGVSQELNFRMLRARGAAAAVSALMGQGALTGPDGAFRLRNIAPSRNLELDAHKTGYATTHQVGITLKPGDSLQGLSLVLRKGLQASGRVVDAENRPVSAAELRLALREGGARGARVQLRLFAMDREKPEAVTGVDGTFVIPGLSPGQYTVVVSREGFARKTIPSLDVKAEGESVWPPIALAAGIALSGVVHDSAGQPIPGAQILAIDLSGGTRPLDASSGPDGRFRMDGLTPDRPLMLNVSADGYASIQKDATPPAQDVAITLKSAGTIRGRVEDAAAKAPITDFTIGTRGSGAGRLGIQNGGTGGDRAFHADDGTFELGSVPPGKWTVHASAAGYRPADIAGVEVGEGVTREGVVLSMKKGGGFTGRVLDPQLGTGVANANVSYQAPGLQGGGGGGFARQAGGNASNTTTTDADGRFTFDGTPEGKVMVTASHPDYLDVTQEVDLSKQSSADLTLGTGGSISGTVVGQDGRTPIPGAQVSLNQEGDTRFGFGGNSTRSDGSGNFLFEHLQAGRFQLVAQSSDGKTTSQEAVLGDSQRLTGILLQMATGTLLQGTVSGLPAGRLGGVRITANGQGYNDNTTTDDSGKFTLQNVPAGVIRLNASTSVLSGRSTSQSVEIPNGAPQFTVEIAFQGGSLLSGRVTRGDTPLSGILVNANPLAGAASTGAGRASGQTDDNGQYALEGLSDVDYVVILAGQGVSYRRNFTVSGDTPGDIQLPPIQLTGTISEAGSGEPLDGATIQLQLQAPAGQTGGGGLGSKRATGDSTGHYFIDDVDPGTYQVTAHRDDYQAKTQSVTVGSDSATLDFGLARGEGISIRVTDGLTGLPLKGVIVAALDSGGSVGYQGPISLDSTGKGEINSLAPGRYAVHFFSDGYASRTAIIDAPSPLVPIALTPGGRVEVVTPVPLAGRLVDGAGLPYQLNAFRSDGRISGAPPVVSWEHIAPGSYQLLLGAPGAEVPLPFTVAEGQTTRVDVK
jgi:protocatechuate 3,4-dioxygenase beta subunit